MRLIARTVFGTFWAVAFTLPFLFLYADPEAKPYFRVRTSWLGGVEESFVLAFGPAIGRVIFCAVWLATIALLFYLLEIRPSAESKTKAAEEGIRGISPFNFGRLRGRPSRTRKKVNNKNV